MITNKTRLTILLGFILLPIFVTTAAVPADYESWSVDQKVDWLLKNMTLAEKINHLNTTPRGQSPTHKQLRDDKYGLTGFVSCDGPRGARWGDEQGICFPVALQMAATWDVDLMEKVGVAYAHQLKHLKANQLFAPGLNIVKHPLAGRNAESFGEDPFLVGKLAAAMIRGVQSQGCIATPKHYACNTFETGRFHVDANVPARVLREIYLPGFRQCVHEGNALSIMTAYHRVNGHFIPANRQLLDILYGWDFKGYVVSGYNAELESAAQALRAGTHVEMAGWHWYTDEEIGAGLKNGSIPSGLFDVRLRKILEIKLNPRFHDPATSPESDPFQPIQQRNLARRTAAEGMILLKNEGGVLPLTKDQTVALIGPFINGDLIVGNQGSSTVAPERVVTPQQAFSERLGNRITILSGCDALTDGDTKGETAFANHAEYFNNLILDGDPAFVRAEADIHKLSFTGAGSARLATGASGRAFAFNGHRALRIGSTPAYLANEDFSWSFWIYLFDPSPDQQAPVWSSYLWQRAQFDLTPAGLSWRVLLGQRPVIGKIDFKLPSRCLAHVSMVRQDGVLSVYVDGKKQGQAPLTTAIPAMPVIVGGDFRGRWHATAVIDEISMYNRALTDTDLKILATKQDVTAGRIFHEDCEDVSQVARATETYPGITDTQTMSASWSGQFTAQQTGKYRFSISSNGGVRFYVDGLVIFEQMQEAWNEGMVRQCWIPMQAGQDYTLVIDYANWFGKQRGPGGFITFEYFEPSPPNDIAAAVAAAQTNDVAVVMVGIPQQVLQGEANDNETFELPAYQNELIQAVAQANPRTVVVLSTAGGCDMRPWLDTVPAVVEAFYPGQEAGYALTDVLFGDINPSGKLPVSYAMSTDQLETQVVQPLFEESVCAVGYRMFDKRGKQPLFPFGHGLSYTSFEYSNLNVKKLGRDSILVSFNVKNTGEIAGAETVQIYVGDPNCHMERPVRELKGFQKVTLAPGKSADITHLLNAWAFSYFDEQAGLWRIDPGNFIIDVGASSRDIRLTDTVALP
ncbi:glycoside hydrolase family 3 C-terminal domain-containing protein [Planctomycetota bacterium]